MSGTILGLGDRAARELDRAGGKGLNLADLAQAGFPVPPGFIVATDAYAEHVAAAGIDRVIAAALADLGDDDMIGLEGATAAIREAIVAAPMPAAIAAEIGRAYRGLGAEPFVAVRSSGTAEDLAEASFAGQHDTYLDVRGEPDLLDAVRRCWASMWSARATAYRLQKGFDQAQLRLAVVVLEMIRSEVSGVLFTANPVTAAVDEYVVNAAWGLGEGIVSGELTPDQFVLDRATLVVKGRHLGAKEIRVVRDSEAGGVRTEPVPEEMRGRFALDDDQLAELGGLGSRLSEHYGEWPQDIEWALADGRFHLLQARDTTGLELCWDEDLEEHGLLPRIPDAAILSRKRADTVWTGRITPLFYSLRAETRTLVTPRMFGTWAGGTAAQRRWGGGGEAIGQIRWYKYLKGAVYFNSEVEYRNQLEFVPPTLRRRELCEWTPPSWLDGFEQQPGSWQSMLRIAARIQLLDSKFSVRRVFETLAAEMEANATYSLGLEPDELRRLSDRELERYFHQTLVMQSNWVRNIAYAFYLYVPYMTALFNWMLERWYPGDAEAVLGQLVSGLPEKTMTVRQNEALMGLARRIRGSAPLLELFRARPGAEFFAALEGRDDAVELCREYAEFMREFGHRGHADRDIWYDRRCEDPAIDYRSIALLLEADEARLGTSDEELVERRRATTAEVLRQIRRRGPLGPLKAALFARVHDFMLRFYVFRDNSRHHTDRGTFAKKRAAVEVGRRLFERRLLAAEDDFYYLSKEELLRLLRGDRRADRVMAAKVAARRRNCDRYRVEWSPPTYIRGDGREHVEPSEVVTVAGNGGGEFEGVAMSRGEATGRARVVRGLEFIGRLEKGDVLVARGTDPGWTPAFPVLAGLVLETGGALAHGALLSREYGIPAVQVTDAMALIEDGATVRVDGTSGRVTVVEATTRDEG